MSLRQACILFCISTSVYYYVPKRKDEDYVIMQELSALAELHKTWGFWLMFHRLRKLNYKWNHKRVYRLYKLMRLLLRCKRKKRLPVGVKEPLQRPIEPNVTWSIDFMHDTLKCGKKIRSLNVIDDFNREVLAICLDTSLPSVRVIRALNQLVEWRCKPDKIRVDNGPEFIAQVLKDWCENAKIELAYIQPGKPTQNSLIERFNRTFRHEVLDCYMFSTISELKTFAYAWMWMYNNERPHAGLDYLTPHEFLLKYGKLQRPYPGEFPTFQQDKNNSSKNDWKSLVLGVAS
jgi:putative transposase